MDGFRSSAEQFAQPVAAFGLSRRDVARVACLLALIVAVAGLHYTTSSTRVVLHELYTYLCYLPIILAAYWYGVPGGLVAALTMSAAFVPHVRTAWAGDHSMTATRYAQVVVFHLIGLTVGILAAAERRLTSRYRDANSELRKSQESLRRADRLSSLGEIAAGLAHEIQNPLASIKGACEIIGSRVQQGTPEAEFAAIAKRELARLESLVSEFLAYARPREPELRQGDLGPVIGHVAALVRPEAERLKVAVHTERAATGYRVLIDSEQIEQVLFNILLNAVQASSPGGRVDIRERLEADHVIVEVTDEGSGIPDEQLARIFDPFFTTKTRGTGLGLAISLRIVAAHSGIIEALPRNGRGTILRVRLPLVAAADAVAPH